MTMELTITTMESTITTTESNITTMDSTTQDYTTTVFPFFPPKPDDDCGSLELYLTLGILIGIFFLFTIFGIYKAVKKYRRNIQYEQLL